MKILPKKYIRVTRGLWVWYNNHYKPTYFGIRYGTEETAYQATQFVEVGAPGTGFYVRNSSSVSYRNFVIMRRKKMRPAYWKLLLGQEFSYNRESIRVRAALRILDEDKAKVDYAPLKGKILLTYLKVLELAQEADRDARIVRGIKDKTHYVHQHRLTAHQKGVLASYKSQIDKKAREAYKEMLMVRDYVPEEQYKRFAEVHAAFLRASTSHRIWHVREFADHSDKNYVQVFFDEGIFDFIQSPLMAPILRDSHGYSYFIYPDFVIKTHSSTNFEIFDIRELSFLYREIPYEMVSSMVRHRTKQVQHHKRIHRDYENFGSGLLVKEETGAVNVEDLESSEHVRMRVVGELAIPQLNLRFYSQDANAMHEFARALKHYTEGLGPNKFVKTATID